MESFQPGDRVTLKERLGPLTTDSVGLVVEVYDRGTTPDGAVIGSKDYDALQGEFDFGVAFPQLRGYVSDYTEGPWLTDKVDLSQFHAGDIVPCRWGELTLVDSALREAAA